MQHNNNANKLSVSAQAFRECYPHLPFKVNHQLIKHPLFEIEHLVTLCKNLDPSQVEYNAGSVPISQDPNVTPMNGLSPEETIQRIRECKSWLVLKFIERSIEYKKLLDECLEEIKPMVNKVTKGMRQYEAFVFISSPDSVTPYHIDPEHNFLLQIRGKKFIHIFDGEDRVVVSDDELERFYNGAHRNLTYRSELDAYDRTYELLPGDGLYFPVNAPHWVKNGEDVSVSFSITFRTDYSARRERLYRLNSKMRKLGVKPTPVGKYPLVDSSKDNTYRVLCEGKNLMRKIMSRGTASDSEEVRKY